MRDKDNEWIIEHEQELEEKYSGKYVAVVEGRIAAVERTSLEAIFAIARVLAVAARVLAVAYFLRRRKRCKE